MSTFFRSTADLLFWTMILLSALLLGLEALTLRYLDGHPRAWDALGRRRALNRSVPEHFRFAAFFWLNRHRELSDPVVNRLGTLLKVLAMAVLTCGVSLYAVAG